MKPIKVFDPQTDTFNLSDYRVTNFEVSSLWLIKVPTGDRKSINVVKMSIAEPDLETLIMEELGCYYDPSSENQTVTEWLESVQQSLSNDRDMNTGRCYRI
ncbi:MAG: hypothetical protein ACM65L_01025 [Microcoleus sp.]